MGHITFQKKEPKRAYIEVKVLIEFDSIETKMIAIPVSRITV